MRRSIWCEQPLPKGKQRGEVTMIQKMYEDDGIRYFAYTTGWDVQNFLFCYTVTPLYINLIEIYMIYSHLIPKPFLSSTFLSASFSHLFCPIPSGVPQNNPLRILGQSEQCHVLSLASWSVTWPLLGEKWTVTVAQNCDWAPSSWWGISKKKTCPSCTGPWNRRQPCHAKLPSATFPISSEASTQLLPWRCWQWLPPPTSMGGEPQPSVPGHSMNFYEKLQGHPFVFLCWSLAQTYCHTFNITFWVNRQPLGWLLFVSSKFHGQKLKLPNDRTTMMAQPEWHSPLSL